MNGAQEPRYRDGFADALKKAAFGAEDGQVSSDSNF
jgi:hypothetical protein